MSLRQPSPFYEIQRTDCGGGSLFVGYVLMQVPSNMLITKVKPGMYMSAWMLVWAVVSGEQRPQLSLSMHSLTYSSLRRIGPELHWPRHLPLLPWRNRSSRMSPCSPSPVITDICPVLPRRNIHAIHILHPSRFVIPHPNHHPHPLTPLAEVAARIALLYCAQILATGFSGLIAAGVFAGLDDVRGLAGWRWLFLLEGAVTALVAIFGFFFLPNAPLTTWWLKPHEKELAHARMERDKLADADDKPASAWDGLKQACRDKRTWLFCLMQNFHLSACSFNSFFPT